MRRKIAVIGAGIAGLTAAYELKKALFEVIVFEKNSYVGGRMATKKSEGFNFDFGAVFLIDKWYSLLSSYAKELGVPWKLSAYGGSHRIIRNGLAHYIDIVGPRQVLGFKLLSLRARIAFLLLIVKIKFFSPTLDFFNLSNNPKALDGVSAEEYLYSSISREVSDYIVAPFTSFMQFHQPDKISKSMLFALLQAMVSIPGGFRVAYTPGGMGMISVALAKYVGVDFELEIDNVRRHNDGVLVSFSGGRAPESFDAVVIATTGDVTKKIMGEVRGTAKQMFNSLAYASTMSIACKIPADLFPDHAHLTYVPLLENQIIAGYDNTIQKDMSMTKEGRSILNVCLHEEAARNYWAKDDEEIFEIVKRELVFVCPEARDRIADIQMIDIFRWSHAMPKFTGELSRNVRQFLLNDQGVDDIYLAGDYLNSPWTEGAARSGVRAAELIIKKFN